jgi:hypothetical protein
MTATMGRRIRKEANYPIGSNDGANKLTFLNAFKGEHFQIRMPKESFIHPLLFECEEADFGFLRAFPMKQNGMGVRR